MKLSGDIAAKLLEDVENLQKTKAEKEELPTQEEKTKWNKATNDYTDLNNKPSINGVELSGDKKTKDLKLSYNDINDTPKNLSDFANDILIQSDSEESAIASSTGDTKKMYYWVEE